jgi:L-lactate dehydrogenase complex protein LldG
MLFQQFKARAEGVGAEVHRFGTGDEALEFVLQFLPATGVAAAPGSFAAWAGGPFLGGRDRGLLAERVPGLSFDVTRELAADALVGISEMDWGLADTGSLVADQSAAEQRLVSTLAARPISNGC